MKSTTNRTVRKTALLSCSFALAGVLAAPTALAQSTTERTNDPDYSEQRRNLDSTNNVNEEYNEAMRDEARGDRNDNAAANPDYSEERRNIDDPDHVDEEYRKAMQEERDAEGRVDGTRDDDGDYLERRKNIDDPDNIEEEYEEATHENRQ